MKSLAKLLALASFFAGAASAAGRQAVYIGTKADGIYAASLDQTTGRLSELHKVAELERPTWVTVDSQRSRLYAVSETGNDGASPSKVASYAIEGAGADLRLINTAPSGGGGATHLALDTQLGLLFVANYGAGQVSALPLRVDGGLQPPISVQTDYGSGPHPRQQSPHAHGVAVDPGRRFLLAADLGADRIFTYRIDPDSGRLTAADPPYTATSPGSGPRHLAFTPDGRFLFANLELAGRLQTFAWDRRRGRLSPVGVVSLDAPDYAGARSAAEIAVSRDGRFLYASNRGGGGLLVFAIDRKSGRLTLRQRAETDGAAPSSFALDPTGKWLIVANEGSQTLAVLRVDPATGRLASTGHTLAAPQPAAVAYYVAAAVAPARVRRSTLTPGAAKP